MRHQFLLFIVMAHVAIGIPSGLGAQLRPLQIRWSATNGTPAHYPVNNIFTTRTGDILGVGYYLSGLTGRITRYDESGALLWSSLFPGWFPASIRELPDGSLVGVGDFVRTVWDSNPWTSSIGVVWLDAEGNELSRKAYGGVLLDFVPQTISHDSASDLVHSRDGDLLIIGNSATGPGNQKTSPHFGSLDGWVLLVGKDGVMKWQRSLGSTGFDRLAAGIETADGGFVVAGQSLDSSLFTKLDAQGNVVWERTYGLKSFIESLCLTDDGGIVLGGVTYRFRNVAGEGRNNAWLIRVSPEGQQVWEKTFDVENDGDCTIRHIRSLTDGRLLVLIPDTSHTRSFRSKVHVRCLSAEGASLWQVDLPGEIRGNGGMILTSDLGFVVGMAARSGEGLLVSVAPESVPNVGPELGLSSLPNFFQAADSLPLISLHGPPSSQVLIESSPDMRQWAPFSTNHLGPTDLKFRSPKSESGNAVFLRATHR